jgi:hypothetical protein
LCRECTARSEALPKEKATGLAVIVGGAEEAILSPLYWILAIAFLRC